MAGLTSLNRIDYNALPYGATQGQGVNVYEPYGGSQGYYAASPQSGYSSGGGITPTSPSTVPVVSPASGGGGGNLGIAGIPLGVLQAGYGLYQLSKMGDAPNYEINPELQTAYNTAMEYAKQGLDPAEMALAKGMNTRQLNTAQKNAINIGGGRVSGAVAAGLNGLDLQGSTYLAAADAKTKLQNRREAQALALDMQNQRNKIRQEQIDQYNRKQAAYGGAVAAGSGNIAGGINSIPQTISSLAPLLALV